MLVSVHMVFAVILVLNSNNFIVIIALHLGCGESSSSINWLLSKVFKSENISRGETRKRL